jgi:hypothetical protein
VITVNFIQVDFQLIGDQANESFLARCLPDLKIMAPEIAEVALSALTGLGTSTLC